MATRSAATPLVLVAAAGNTSIAVGNECPIALTRKEKIKPLLSLSKKDGEISMREVPEPKAFAVYPGHFFWALTDQCQKENRL